MTTTSVWIIKSDKGAVLYVEEFGTRKIGYELANVQLFSESPVDYQYAVDELAFIKKLYPAHSWTLYKISIY